MHFILGYFCYFFSKLRKKKKKKKKQTNKQKTKKQKNKKQKNKTKKREKGSKMCFELFLGFEIKVCQFIFT